MKYVALLLIACSAPKAEQRAQCKFKPGALVKDTADFPKTTGLEHIVLMMQENRSFDHYFAAFPGAKTTVTPHPAQHFCVKDLPHSWTPAHKQWQDGTNEGFLAATGGDNPERTFDTFGEAELPFYYALARTFTLSDMHFSSLLAGTWPNRMFLLGGSNWGMIKNLPPPTRDAEGKRYLNLFDQLGEAGIEFRMYRNDTPTMLLFLESYGRYSDRVFPVEQYFTDLQNGDLAPFSMVEPFFTGFPRNDEHPPNNPQRGQQFSASVITALMNSSSWKSSALILTWDENGGFYDSMPPPAACEPGHEVDGSEEERALGRMDRLGFRTPLMVVSPFAKRGHLSHATTDHSSILRFIQGHFGFGALTGRDANADPLTDMFDFEHPDYSVPSLPEATIDATQDADCLNRFGEARRQL